MIPLFFQQKTFLFASNEHYTLQEQTNVAVFCVFPLLHFSMNPNIIVNSFGYIVATIHQF